MKNIFKNIGLFILIFNCYSSTAQTQREQLVGTWVFDYETSLTHMDEQAKKALAKIPTMQGRLESGFKNRRITLASDGNYLLHLPDGKEVAGTWELDTINGNGIIIHYQYQIENLSIILLSSQALVLKPENNGNAKPMLSTWYFTKI